MSAYHLHFFGNHFVDQNFKRFLKRNQNSLHFGERLLRRVLAAVGAHLQPVDQLKRKQRSFRHINSVTVANLITALRS